MQHSLLNFVIALKNGKIAGRNSLLDGIAVQFMESTVVVYERSLRFYETLSVGFISSVGTKNKKCPLSGSHLI